MEHAQSNQGPSFAVRLIKLPLQGLWFLIKHPIVAIVMALLIAFSSVSFLAHYNKAIADRFNNAMGSFLGATLLSEASDALRRVPVQPDKSKAKIAALEAELKKKEATISRKNAALTKASNALNKTSTGLEKASNELYKGSDIIRQRGAEINRHNAKLEKFRVSGKSLEKKATQRFTKVALFDATGEILGWIPVMGDAASIGLAAKGIYEMCQMFKEIESATEELGVRYRVYTDTFCEKPVEKSAEVVSDFTKSTKDSIGNYVSTLVYRVKNIL